MEITIGVQFSQREITVETKASSDDVQKLIENAYASGQKLLWLTDEKGKRIAVPTDKLAYVELGSDKDSRRVGFASE